MKHLKQLKAPTGYAKSSTPQLPSLRFGQPLASLDVPQRSRIFRNENTHLCSSSAASAVRRRSVFSTSLSFSPWCPVHTLSTWTTLYRERGGCASSSLRHPVHQRQLNGTSQIESSVGSRVVCLHLPRASSFEQLSRLQHSIVDPSTSTKLTCRLFMLEKIISHRSRPMLYPVASPPRRTGVQPAA